MSTSIPKSLRDDHLKDTIITILFRTNYNRRFIHERILENLSQDEKTVVPGEKNLDNPEALLYGMDNFRIRLDRGQIQFNCITNYPGWEAYGAKVKLFLEALAKYLDYNTVQIRYINVFEGIHLFQNINGTIHIKSFPPIKGEEYAFRVNIVDKEEPSLRASATTRLINDRPISPQETASFLDITLESKATNDNFETVLEFLHKHEKLLFFSIITEEFKNSLGPIY